uniref:CUE domain-containing protein n=1 Tax=Neogobius melanostomus TaxID=47308 RepID=A0A8C6UFJ5_9GOBI
MEIQKMRDIQREKAERLEQRKQQEEKARRAQFQLDHARVTDKFLQQLDTKVSSSRMASAPIPNTREVPNVLPKNLEAIQQDQKRKNAEFLDNLERRMGASNMSGAASSSPSESLDQESSSRPRVSPGPRSAGRAAGEDEPNTASEQDFDWALMKLTSNFPHCDKDFLRDILSQCSGDYQQAHGLISLS